MRKAQLSVSPSKASHILFLQPKRKCKHQGVYSDSSRETVYKPKRFRAEQQASLISSNNTAHPYYNNAQ